MSGAIRGMRRRTFYEGLLQQGRARRRKMREQQPSRDQRSEDVWVNLPRIARVVRYCRIGRVGRQASKMDMNAAAKFLRPKTAVNTPLQEPHVLECPCRDFRDEGQNMR